MIEIKQDGIHEHLTIRKHQEWDIIVIQQGDEDVRIEGSTLPHLITRLIELGGVGEDIGKIQTDWMESGRNELFSAHIQKNYHLIQKTRL